MPVRIVTTLSGAFKKNIPAKTEQSVSGITDGKDGRRRGKKAESDLRLQNLTNSVRQPQMSLRILRQCCTNFLSDRLTNARTKLLWFARVSRRPTGRWNGEPTSWPGSSGFVESAEATASGYYCRARAKCTSRCSAF